MFEEARAIEGTLVLCKLTQKQLGERLGVSQSYVANKIRLLSLSPEERKIIEDNGLSECHARCVLRLSDQAKRREILNKCVRQALTVRECEALVDTALVSELGRDIEANEGRKRIEHLSDGIKRSVEAISAAGIRASERTSYYGNKMYITVCIENP